MERFHFQLEKVLGYKTQVLDGLAGEEAVIMARIKEKERELAELNDEYEEYCDILNEKQKSGTDAMTMHIYENYLEALGCRIRNTMQELQLIYRQEEIKRQQMVEAKKETTSLEKLKERRHEEYRVSFQKQEEKALEEFISNTHRAMMHM